MESSFTAPALPFLENNNDTECRDYLFIGGDGQTKSISGQNAFPGLWTGDRYLITGRDLDTGKLLYYQTDTIFAGSPDTPVTPDTPGGNSDAPAGAGAPAAISPQVFWAHRPPCMSALPFWAQPSAVWLFIEKQLTAQTKPSGILPEGFVRY